MVERAPDSYSSWGLERWELLALNTTSREVVTRLEKAEQTVPQSTPKASDAVRDADFKVDALDRRGLIDSKTKEQYEEMLKNHLLGIDKPVKTQLNYNESARGLLEGIGWLKTKDGRNISDVQVDAWIIEGISSVYEGTKKGVQIAIEELKKQLETLISPEEWQKIVEWLLTIAKDPIKFMNLLIEWVKTEAAEVWKEVETMYKNSTTPWFSAEMGKYIPEVWVPMLIGTVGVWKFLKIFGLEWLLWEKIIAKIAQLDLAKDRGKYTVRQWEVFGEFLNKTEAFNKIFTIESLPTNPKNFPEAIRIMRTMTAYVIDHEKTIPWMHIETKGQAKHNMERLVNKMTMMVDHPDFAQYKKEYKSFLDGDLGRAYYILIPEWKPK
ncbi:MAG: hypothetical protein ACD_71C00179G0018 [uncultured bacterium (gcode 4)]|uniref:Uncharacterized protein n=1 Tax=uncultured bacterium (gcode 4) TaxID=1234023 RepID=K1ZIR8_9BACT|nr:MAG: hypothetical protein ACD_71C00179G0018 [uncultured bacterium (gcode 4)]